MQITTKYLVMAIAITSLQLTACKVSTTTDVDEDDTAVDVEQPTENNNSNDNANQSDSSWVINQDNTRSVHIIDSSTGQGVLVNVQSVEDVQSNGVDYTLVTSDGVPDYQVEITQDIYDALANRPKANSDFVNAQPDVSVGERVNFGQDIGYSSNVNCQNNEGYGYWPPGPECPTQDTRTVYLPKSPQVTDQDCDSGLGKVGLWVNGSSVYNWGDGQTYNNEGDWNTLAPVAEQYDVDICGGHAANGDYHHHFYSTCLADMVGDMADGHSPLYGYAADGYPIYGPWEADGILAKSSWTTRDYSANSAMGCSDGSRSCVLVDQYDVSQGTEAVNAGPGFDQTVRTLSGNFLVAYNGFYHQDYYWDANLTAQGSPYLDQYNGHTDAQRGYHYHITVTADNHKLSPAFPYIIGDRFAGKLQDNAVASCRTAGTMGPPNGARP